MINELLSEVNRLSQKKEIVLIAIDGVGGSGKTTLAELIGKSLKNSIIIQMDDFYSPTLQSADLLRLKEQVLLPLHNLHKAQYQIFEWRTNSFSDWRILEPKGIFIFEGVYALEKTVRDFYDVNVWVDYPADLGFQRGIARDIERDGIDNTDLWRKIWMPLEKKYIHEQEPYRAADYILNGANISNP